MNEMKVFNTTGLCNPTKHYMVDISETLKQIKAMVDAGKYFCINRARQYGKTTTLTELAKILSSQYNVVNISFQGIGKAGFETEERFVQSISRLIRREKRAGTSIPEETICTLSDYIDRKENLARLDELYDTISEWCAISKEPVVLMIDEVDSASENQVFLDFLGQLREAFLSREGK